MNTQLFHEVANLLYIEGALLDEHKWDEWLNLYTEDCEFWMPAWDSEHEYTKDPKKEISLMYYNSRAGLEDRVWRIKSGMSSASTPLPRTWHAVHNIRLGKEEGESIEVFANWQSHAFKEGETRTFYGRSEYQLKKVANTLKISRKMVLLINDVIPSVLDIYNI